MKYLVVILFSFNAHAWFCEESSSERKGGSIYACGIGEDRLEAEARSKALDDSKREFSKLFSGSAELIPMRVSCDKTSHGFKCFRMIEFHLNAESKGEIKQDVSMAKVSDGMSQSEVISLFGEPTRAKQSYDELMLIYQDKSFCEAQICIAFIQGGKVSGHRGFKYKNTNLLAGGK